MLYVVFLLKNMNNLPTAPQLHSQSSGVVTADNIIGIISYLDRYLDELAMAATDSKTANAHHWYNVSGYGCMMLAELEQVAGDRDR